MSTYVKKKKGMPSNSQSSINLFELNSLFGALAKDCHYIFSQIKSFLDKNTVFNHNITLMITNNCKWQWFAQSVTNVNVNGISQTMQIRKENVCYSMNMKTSKNVVLSITTLRARFATIWHYTIIASLWGRHHNCPPEGYCLLEGFSPREDNISRVGNCDVYLTTRK